MPLREANINIMTHAFMYGTATFEGIRGYWNEERGTLFGLFIREHVERIRNSCRILLIDPVPSVDELTGLIVETVRRNHFREDVYIRPSFYKSTKAIGVRLHDIDNELYIITLPFGNYIDTDRGVRLMTSSWRRNADEALPARGKNDAAAYAWINFTMRPDVAARITKKVGNWTAAKGTEALVDPRFKAQFEARFPAGAFQGIRWYPPIPPGLEENEGRILDRIKAGR